MLIMADFVVQTVIKEALTEISNNTNILDALFSELKKAHLSGVYGQDEIDIIKSFFQKNQITVVTGWSQISSRYPSYSIQLSSSSEVASESALGDFLYDEYLLNDNKVNVHQNELTYPKNNQNYDEKNEVYGTPIQESIIIGCHAIDKPNIARYMAWVLHYILRSKLQTFIDRGLDRINLSFSDFNQANEYLPETMFTRFCTFSCFHYLKFSKEINPFALDSVNTVVKAQIQESEYSEGTTDQGDEDEDTVITID